MGVTTAFASPSPYDAVKDAAPLLASNGDPQIQADAADVTSGAMLAGLVHAYEIGAYGNTTPIANLANGIIDIVDSLPAGQKFFFGNEAYGIARTGQVGVAINESYDGTAYTNATTLISDFYNTYVPANGGSAARAANVVSPTADPTNPDSGGIYDLSYHVLASDLVGSTEAGTYRSTLQTALANFDTTASDTANNVGAGATGTTQALATALWALATTGTTGTEGIITGDTFGNKTLAQLKADLIAQIDLTTNTFFQRLNDSGTDNDAQNIGTQDTDLAQGYAEDLAYGILALKALNDNTLTDIQRIQNLEYALAWAVDAGTGTPLNILDDQKAFSAQYSGAALQALPEPAALSLLAIGGLGLLARRRRQA
jgi:hypothetical protein